MKLALAIARGVIHFSPKMFEINPSNKTNKCTHAVPVVGVVASGLHAQLRSQMFPQTGSRTKTVEDFQFGIELKV